MGHECGEVALCLYILFVSVVLEVLADHKKLLIPGIVVLVVVTLLGIGFYRNMNNANNNSSLDANSSQSVVSSNNSQSKTSSSNAGNKSNDYHPPKRDSVTDPYTYVLNTSTHKIHIPSCSSAARIADKNYATWSGPSAQEFLDANPRYTRCQRCNPR